MRPYREPLLLGSSVLVGLVLALFSDGVLDLFAISLVSVPLIGVAVAVFRSSRTAG